MSTDTDMKKLTRLSSILLQPQTKRVINSTNLADRFGVTKDKAELLSKRIAVSPASIIQSGSEILSGVRSAPTSFEVLRITYHAENSRECTERFYCSSRSLHVSSLSIRYLCRQLHASH